ncbi:hypothetical protein [Gramella sp. KN1008]|uniref:hypothetical protein n=1 Tax=Gramella sp. KN1008 TaxID=2529298 RepID=UPI00103E7A71|nr:hypothetical protein [Gramella sp. KN1008]TBW25604.1 hypothetical protein EZJ28_15760 [Gramella sp. KN1008]
MRRIITFLVIGLLFSCSVEDDSVQPEDQIVESFAIAEAGSCEADVFNVLDGGAIEVTNIEDEIYIKISANPGFELGKVSFQVSKDISNFPVENNGKLNPQKLANSKSFEPETFSHTLGVNWTDSEKAVIALYVTFKQKSGPTVSGWAGNLSAGNEQWSYVDYVMCTPQADPCEEFSAGSDNKGEIQYSNAKAIESKDEATKLYLSLLDKGVSRNGTFEPRIVTIIEMFNNNDLNGNPYGEYSTVYTISEGECSASVRLTYEVIPDFSDPICTLDAGASNSKEITISEARALESKDEVTKQYLSLLESGVPRDGVFDPRIMEIIELFNSRENPLGDYTTLYTITDGECTDSVELTIRVVAD